MLNSKFDLYKPEWLELVFDNRNKEYGAYTLRRNYASNMVNAMGITFFGVAVLFTANILLRSKPVPIVQEPANPPLVVTITPPPITPPKKPATPEPVKQTVPVKTTAFVPFIVKPDPDIVKSPPVITDLTGAVGQTTTPGKSGGGGVVAPTPGPGSAIPEDVSVHPNVGLDVMPEPVGGDGAWAKFLNKNLRFPAPAREDGISGRVILSFIIEKDGHLSNIVVDKPAGHGFDEEAMRVLNLAKAWKPGMQNGQAVRVKYYIPINFQLDTE